MLGVSLGLLGQGYGRVDDLRTEAMELHKKGNYLEAMKKHREAFRLSNGSGFPWDFYNAACTWSMANRLDTALRYLKTAIDVQGSPYLKLKKLESDSDLSNLTASEHWPEIVALLQSKSNAETQKGASIDKRLKSELLEILRNDQVYRNKRRKLEQKFGIGSRQVEENIRQTSVQDSINLLKIEKLLDEKGWVGPSEVGEEAASAIFFVLQHSDNKTRQKYLSLMQKAVSDGKETQAHLAMFTDRMAVDEGVPQTYGTQMHYDKESASWHVYPIGEPDTINHRRKEVGLPPMELYVSHWSITWDPKKHLEWSKRFFEQK